MAYPFPLGESYELTKKRNMFAQNSQKLIPHI